MGLGLGSGEVERHRLDVHGQLSLHRLADELLHLVRARGADEGLGVRLGLGLGAGVRARVGAKVRIGSPAWVRVGDGAEFMRGSSTFWHSCGVMALVCEKSKRA